MWSDVQVLPLVFVNALGLNVEQRGRVHRHAGAVGDARGETAFGGEFDFAPFLPESGIVGQRLQLAQLVEVFEPAVADAPGDELCQRRIGNGQETPRRDAVGDVAEFLRPQLGEIAQDGLLQQIRVQSRDAVDVVAADRGQMRHADVAFAAFVNQRQPRHAGVVAGKPDAHFVQETAVDFVNDFQMPRQQRAEERHRPLFQRLGQQRVVGVGKGVARDVPGGVPVQRVLVHQQAHQLGDGQRRMRVVELHGPFLVELLQRPAEQPMHAEHVLQASR